MLSETDPVRIALDMERLEEMVPSSPTAKEFGRVLNKYKYARSRVEESLKAVASRLARQDCTREEKVASLPKLSKGLEILNTLHKWELEEQIKVLERPAQPIRPPQSTMDPQLEDIRRHFVGSNRELADSLLYDLGDRTHQQHAAQTVRKGSYQSLKDSSALPDPFSELKRRYVVPRDFHRDILPRYCAMDVIDKEDPSLTADEAQEPPVERPWKPPETARRNDKRYHLTVLVLEEDEEQDRLSLLLDKRGRPLSGAIDMAISYCGAVNELLKPAGYKVHREAPSLLPACFVGEAHVHYFAVLQKADLISVSKDTRPGTAADYHFADPQDPSPQQKVLWYSVFKRVEKEHLQCYFDSRGPQGYPRKGIRAEVSTRLGRLFRQDKPHGPGTPLQRTTQHGSYTERVFDAFVAQTPELRENPELVRAITLPLWFPSGASQLEGSQVIELDCQKQTPVEALCDTGAMGEGYVHPDVVTDLKLETRKCSKRIVVANSKVVRATQEAFVTAIVVAPDGQPTVIRDWFVVFDVPVPIILGLPTLVGKMGNCFLQHLKALVDAHSNSASTAPLDAPIAGPINKKEREGKTRDRSVSDLLDAGSFDERDFAERHRLMVAAQHQEQQQDRPQELEEEFAERHDAHLLVKAWTQLSETAPEDEATPLPSDFAERLNFMEVSPEQARSEYLEKFESRLGKPLDAHPEIRARICETMRTKGAQAFVPQSWEGITDVVFKINWREDLPRHLKPKARPVNQKLFEHVQAEFKRLASYMYIPHDGPHASPLVVAPKATPPFIRLCGDYREVNKYIDGSHYPIPDIKKMLARLQGKRYYIDLDLTNAFHQVRLDPESSARLSVQFPWGQYRPLFLPEGVKPGSQQLQRVAMDVFGPIAENSLIAFDNLLIMADTMEEAAVLLDKALEICISRNVYLKLSKSNIVVDEVDFFGFRVTPTGMRMQDAKREEIDKIPFPTDLPRARSFIGSTVYYSAFIPHYSTVMAPLQKMLSPSFNWRDQELLDETRAAFNAYKDALKREMELTYPDYSLPWTLRTDASTFGVGAVLFQTRTLEDGSLRHEPLYFISQKFSDPATRWSTLEQEGYAIYYALKQLEYYLWGKPLVVETDHANLVWIEQSVVPKVIRWRLYMQSFRLMVRHIAGKSNRTADYLSRLHVPPGQEHLLFCGHGVFARTHAQEVSAGWRDSLEDEAEPLEWAGLLNQLNVQEYLCPTREARTKRRRRRSDDDDDDDDDDDHEEDPQPRPEPQSSEARKEPVAPGPEGGLLSDEDMLRNVHGGRRAHMGAARTWQRLRDEFPGHKVPYAFVEEFVATCPTCQKHRLDRGKAYLKPQVRHLPADHPHKSLGIDTLEMAQDKRGNRYALVLVNHFTKLTHIFPVKKKDADTTARCLLTYFSLYGRVEQVRSDQGSDFDSEVVRQLHLYLGISQKFSLVRRHESSGVERTNREIRRHITALLADEELYGQWSDETVLPLVQFTINSSVNAETGMTPFALHFGSDAQPYLDLPEAGNVPEKAAQVLKQFDSHLRQLRATSLQHLQKVQAERAAGNQLQTRYRAGDLVLYDNRLLSRRNKNTDALWEGPFEVLEQTNNDIKCRHTGLDTRHELHCGDVKLFQGSKSRAETAARYDGQQSLVTKVLGHRGSHHRGRRNIQFHLEYRDGDRLWHKYSEDIQATKAVQEYCAAHGYLRHLTERGEAAQQLLDEMAAEPYPDWLQPKAKVFVDLRCFDNFYEHLGLPEQDHRRHFVEALVHEEQHKVGSAVAKFSLEILLYRRTKLATKLSATQLWVQQYVVEKLPAGAILVDAAFARLHPQLMTESGKLPLSGRAEQQPAGTRAVHFMAHL